LTVLCHHEKGTLFFICSAFPKVSLLRKKKNLEYFAQIYLETVLQKRLQHAKIG
jgi:hypothetical protein